jgi:hypothetical protein
MKRRDQKTPMPAFQALKIIGIIAAVYIVYQVVDLIISTIIITVSLFLLYIVIKKI